MSQGSSWMLAGLRRFRCPEVRGERFGLVGQMDRAAMSIPSNIASGYGRATTQDLSRRRKDGQKDEKFRHYCLLPNP